MGYASNVTLGIKRILSVAVLERIMVESITKEKKKMFTAHSVRIICIFNAFILALLFKRFIDRQVGLR